MTLCSDNQQCWFILVHLNPLVTQTRDVPCDFLYISATILFFFNYYLNNLFLSFCDK